MYNLQEHKLRELEIILRSLNAETRRALHNIIALIFNEGYNKGLKSKRDVNERHRMSRNAV